MIVDVIEKYQNMSQYVEISQDSNSENQIQLSWVVFKLDANFIKNTKYMFQHLHLKINAIYEAKK